VFQLAKLEAQAAAEIVSSGNDLFRLPFTLATVIALSWRQSPASIRDTVAFAYEKAGLVARFVIGAEKRQ